MRRAVIIGSLLFAGLLLLLIVFPFGGPPAKPKVTVTLVSRSNDVSGAYARFAITNESPFPVIRHVGYTIQVPINKRGWTTCSAGWFMDQGNLESGDSELVVVPIPTNQPTWRLSVQTLHQVSTPTLMMRKARATVQSLVRTGKRQGYHNPRHPVRSAWINESPPPDLQRPAE